MDKKSANNTQKGVMMKSTASNQYDHHHHHHHSSSGSDVSDDDQMELRRGPWTVEEDLTLINYIAAHGEGRWNSLARCAGQFHSSTFIHLLRDLFFLSFFIHLFLLLHYYCTHFGLEK